MADADHAATPIHARRVGIFNIKEIVTMALAIIPIYTIGVIFAITLGTDIEAVETLVTTNETLAQTHRGNLLLVQDAARRADDKRDLQTLQLQDAKNEFHTDLEVLKNITGQIQRDLTSAREDFDDFESEQKALLNDIHRAVTINR